MKPLGDSLRAVRRERKLSLEELSRKAEVSKSQLSQIERNASVPTVTRLARIAGALDINLTQLFADDDEPAAGPPANGAGAGAKHFGIVRRDGRRKVIMPWGAWYEILCPDLRHRLEFLYIHYPVGMTAEEPYTHRGEECGLVLEGTLTGIFEDREEVILGTGDSIHFDSTIPHFFKNAGEVDATAIWAITPPSF